MPQTISYLNTPFLGTTILRIMARVAAQRGGLPPVTDRRDLAGVRATSAPHRPFLRPGTFRRASPRRWSRTSAGTCAVTSQRELSAAGAPRADEIDLHLSSHVSTTELAERLGVSTSTLARRFKSATGITIAAYIAQQRAERAARLLATTTQSVRDIARSSDTTTRTTS